MSYVGPAVSGRLFLRRAAGSLNSREGVLVKIEGN